MSLSRLVLILSLALPSVALAQPVPAPRPAPAPAPASGNDARTFVIDRVVAVVDDQIIVESEVRARLSAMAADIQAITDPKERARRVDKLRSQLLDEMINEQLIVAAAAEARIEVTLDEVNAAVDDIKKQNKLDDAQLAAALAEQGYTLGGYKEDLRRQLLRLRAVNQLVRPKVNVTDEDVRAKYAEMSRRADSVSAVRLSHILIKVPDKATEQDLAKAKDRAATIVQRAKAGEDFTKLAAEASDDDGTKGSGGELGWFERGSINPEWESVVFAMDKGDVRGPISGPQGLHVFLVTDTKRTDLKSFDQLKEQIRGDLQRREMDKQSATWIQELRKKAYIDIKM